MKKAIIAMLLLFCMIYLVPVQVYAAPTIDAVQLERVKQEKTYWCWAGSGVCILKYFGKNVTQSSFVTYVYGGIVNTTALDTQVQSGLAHWGVTSTYLADRISFAMLRSEITTHSRPVYAGLTWTVGAGGGHAVVISGYDQSMVTKMIEYMDPADGNFHAMSYDEFAGISSSGQIWDGTLYQMS